MPNPATLLSRQQIIDALESIIANGITLKKSTGYDISYMGQFFPPKEVIRIAIDLAGLGPIDEPSFYGGDSTNNPLRALGFEIVAKKEDEQTPLAKYYSGVVCKPDADYCEWIFDIIQAESAFVFHEDSANHHNFYNIQADDYFLLNYKRKFVAYGKVMNTNERTDNDGWTKSIKVQKWVFFDANNRGEGIDRYGIGDAHKGSNRD